jgi:all-trans-retinol 13,14-reductase
MNAIQNNSFSVVIIGGGLGGLAAGAKLAREGKQVLLIERNPTIGGCARVVPGRHFSYEFSLHELFGMEKGALFRDIFEEFGLSERVELVRLPNFYRAVLAGADITIPFGKDEATASLRQAFPSEERGIGRFFKLLEAINRESNQWGRRDCNSKIRFPLFPIIYPHLTRYANMTVGKYLDATFSGDQIKCALAALLPWYHDDPYATSLLCLAYGHSSCFLGGGFYPKGGSQKLSDELGRIITVHGGTILVNHSVQEIVVRNGRACGVVYHQNNASSEVASVHAEKVIANAAFPHVANDLLREPAKQKILSRIGRSIPGISFLCVALKFRRPMSELGNRAYSTVVIHPKYSTVPLFAEGVKTSDYAVKTFAFTDYSIIDNGVAGGGQHLGVLIVVDTLSQWEGLSNDACDAKKEMVATVLIQRLNELLPGAKNEVEAYEVATPRTYYEQTKNPGGTPYGFAMIPKQVGVRMMANESPIKGLYFASAWVRPGAGYAGTICGGYNCARLVLKGFGKMKEWN